MRVEELTGQWLADADRSICLIGNEFATLNEKQLSYRVHIHRCNIRQIMQHLVKSNVSLITGIEHALPEAITSGKQPGFKAGWIGKYALRRAENIRCIIRNPGITSPEALESAHGIITELIRQQNKLKDLIILCNKADLNIRLVPFMLFGLIKLSIGESVEYLFLCQKNHFRLARRILMLQ
jgi:hypothetical protein